MVGEIDDLALALSFNGRMGRIYEALQTFRKPMVAAGLFPLTVHSLLNDCPVPIVGNNERVQIELETILNRRAIHLGY